MSHQISEFEQFLLLFNQLQATAGTPSRFKTFYSESAPIRRAGDALESFLMRTDFERKKFHGPKRFLQVPANFENRWREFKEDWQPLLYDIIFADLLPLLELEPDYDPEAKTDQLVSPDPETVIAHGSASGFPASVRRMASKAPIARRRPVSITERMSA